MSGRDLRALASVGIALTLLCGCGCAKKAPAAELAGSDASTTEASGAALVTAPGVAFDAIAGFAACTLGYRGVVVDLGEDGARARLGTKLEAPAVESVEREGASWARVRTRALSVGYYETADDTTTGEPQDGSTFVQVHVRALAAKSLGVFLDGKAIGNLTLPKGETDVAAVKAPNLQRAEGEHEVLLRFLGGSKATSDPFAEVDWIHVGTGDPDPRYAAPTRTDARVSARLDGASMQALSLRAPGFARCTTWVPADARVEARIGLAGGGDGDAAIRILRDRKEPVVLGTVHLHGDQGRTEHVSWPVGDLGNERGALVAVEFVARSAAKGTRILFGEPRVVTPKPEAIPPLVGPVARGVVLVVLGELSTHSLALYGGSRPVPELITLAKDGITFDMHRATSGLASGALASMLTGKEATVHTLDDGDARLPHSLTTIADLARDAGIAAAMFTANPTTGAAFGFDRGWSTFEEESPTSDAPATTLFDRAAAWLGAHKSDRFVLVIHARGGHPPWDVTPDALKALPPEGYSGSLDAKHAAELLGRARKVPGSLRWNDADRTRAWALYALAVDAHDAAIGGLMQTLRGLGRDADTAVIVTGDIAVNEAAHIPFADAEALDEASLSPALVIRLPGGALGGQRVNQPTSSADVARTVLGILGLEPPQSFGGLDLLDVTRKSFSLGGRPLTATANGRFAIRWDHYVLSGQRGRENKLCDLSLEAACLTDVRPTYAIALEALHRAAFKALVEDPERSPPPPREPATLDATTGSMLRAWGR